MAKTCFHGGSENRRVFVGACLTLSPGNSCCCRAARSRPLVPVRLLRRVPRPRTAPQSATRSGRSCRRSLSMLDFQQDDSGATLKRTGECFRWKVGEWFKVLRVAVAFGWYPHGTEPPRGISKKAWAGDYLTAQRQRVTSEDAEQLAQALLLVVANLEEVSTAHDSNSLKAIEFVDVRWQGSLSDFAAFCRRGPFRITDDVCNG